ncbi:DUF4118 domain-containing protein [Dactylosporangium sp. NPDC005572]|uniref:sensor histidine kinase n=1 Tax=Dactylosporangium sp. NPDC005572 TaxID=3156889 RepID=UPI0033AD76A3
MRARLLSLLLRPTQPPLALGLVVAAGLVVAETLVLYPLSQATHQSVKGVIYLLGVLVVATVWGAWLGAVTSVASALAFNYFHLAPFWSLHVNTNQNLEELALFIVAGLMTSGLADLARSRAVEATERRREADLAAELAHIMLGADELHSALGAASRRLAEVFELPSAAIELGPVAADERRAAFPLRDGATRMGVFLVPADLPEHTLMRLRQRVVPSLEALLRAAFDREASRERLNVLVQEQAALRQVATLVAGGVSPTEVFGAVTAELGRLLGLDSTILIRFEADGTASRVSGRTVASGAVGNMHVPLDGDNVAVRVLRTGRAARIDDYDNATGRVAAIMRGSGIRSAVGVPVVVDGRLWGVASVTSSRPQPIPPGVEARLAAFTELVATAIANADSRTQLMESRARIVAAADDARRRVERDLHDGAQQRLVALSLDLRTAQAALPDGPDPVKALLSQTVEGLTGVFNDLREIARGIHPAILSEGGLGPALKTLARRSPVPVALNLHLDREMPDPVEVAAYYVVSEALTNAAKHARASAVCVEVEAGDAMLRILAQDDGVGGADPGKGSGMIGLQDRVETLGGSMEVVSPVGHGTTLLVKIPIGSG